MIHGFTVSARRSSLWGRGEDRPRNRRAVLPSPKFEHLVRLRAPTGRNTNPITRKDDGTNDGGAYEGEEEIR